MQRLAQADEQSPCSHGEAEQDLQAAWLTHAGICVSVKELWAELQSFPKFWKFQPGYLILKLLLMTSLSAAPEGLMD